MSIAKLRKELDKVRPPAGQHQTAQSLVLSDSKGRYIQPFCTTASDFNIIWHNVSGARLQQLFEWTVSNIDRISHGQTLHIYIWAGTCDLTTKVGRYIHLSSHDKNAIISNIETCMQKFYNLKDNRHYLEVTFLQIPPFSIKVWNTARGHPDSDTFKEQDNILLDIIHQLNQIIQHKNNIHSVRPSPRFELDVTRNRKSHHGRQSQYYVNFSLYIDGIHPSPTLSRLWMRKIGILIQRDCYN